MTTTSLGTTVYSRQFSSNRQQKTTQQQSVSNSQSPTGSSTAVNQQQPAQEQPVSSSNSAAVRQQQPAQRQPVDNREQLSNNRQLSNHQLTTTTPTNNFVGPAVTYNITAEGVCQTTTSLCVCQTTGGGHVQLGQSPSSRQRPLHDGGALSSMPATIMEEAWGQHQHNEGTTFPSDVIKDTRIRHGSRACLLQHKHKKTLIFETFENGGLLKEHDP